MERLDRYLAKESSWSRSEVKKLIKAGRVSVNGKTDVRPEIKTDPDRDRLTNPGRMAIMENRQKYSSNGKKLPVLKSDYIKYSINIRRRQLRYLLCAINAKYIYTNLAVLSLQAYCRKRYEDRDSRDVDPRLLSGGIPEVLVREYTINHHVDDILQDLYSVGADVFIFSTYIWNVEYVSELAEELNARADAMLAKYPPLADQIFEQVSGRLR